MKAIRKLQKTCPGTRSFTEHDLLVQVKVAGYEMADSHVKLAIGEK